ARRRGKTRDTSMSEWDRPPAGFVPPPQQVQRLARDSAAGAVKPRRRVGWMIPPQRNADFRPAGGQRPDPEPRPTDWQFTTDDARAKRLYPTCEV
ncbi:MAG: hypothetical protein OXL34_12055, partial [Gemmatimonadota bacterium]|nr:hypothetical protein [Gemmatimonadota bacterium]